METSHGKEHPLDGERLYSIINSQMQKSLRDIGVSEVKCKSRSEFKDMDLCTVYTTTNGAYEIRLVFCAERTFLSLIAESMLGEPVTDQEDIKECAMEFFNVVCGHIVTAIFKETRSPARFHCPCFEEGYYLPGREGTDEMLVYCYLSIQNGTAVFMHDPLTLMS